MGRHRISIKDVWTVGCMEVSNWYGKMVKTHRVAMDGGSMTRYLIVNAGVLHRCDVSLCCNPERLFLGTNDDNNVDKALKDRGKKRLTHAKAQEIHMLYRGGVQASGLAPEIVRQARVTLFPSPVWQTASCRHASDTGVNPIPFAIAAARNQSGGRHRRLVWHSSQTA